LIQKNFSALILGWCGVSGELGEKEPESDLCLIFRDAFGYSQRSDNFSSSNFLQLAA